MPGARATPNTMSDAQWPSGTPDADADADADVEPMPGRCQADDVPDAKPMPMPDARWPMPDGRCPMPGPTMVEATDCCSAQRRWSFRSSWLRFGLVCHPHDFLREWSCCSSRVVMTYWKGPRVGEGASREAIVKKVKKTSTGAQRRRCVNRPSDAAQHRRRSCGCADQTSRGATHPRAAQAARRATSAPAEITLSGSDTCVGMRV